MGKRQEKEEVLLREIIVNRSMNGVNANEVRYLEFDGGDAGIFKPKAGEKLHLRNYTKSGTYFLRERAVYLVDCALEFDLVPPTIIREIDGKVGSVQLYIPNAQPRFSPTEKNRAGWEFQRQIRKLWILDLLVRHSDRRDRNILIAGEKVHAIDNGLSFSRDALYLNGDYRGRDLPPGIASSISRLLGSRVKREELDRDLRELLPENEVDAFWLRLPKIHAILVENHNQIPWGAGEPYEFV